MECDALLGCTGDAFKSSRLERMVSAGAMTNSYKLLWLRGIFEEVCASQREIAFGRIVARMVAAAWYPHIYFKLSFGLQDKMGECVQALQQASGLANDASAAEVVQAACACSDEGYLRCMRERCKYVPYRLIRLFYEDELAAIRQRQGKLPDHMVDPAIAKANQTSANGAPYTINAAGDGLCVEADWAAYMRDNQQVIKGWLDMRLVQYLQARNPSVPAVPSKIYPPQARDLSAATKYWREALALVPMREIYTNLPFDEAAFAQMGQLSIDHFVPWSFVLHDEPWNLAPMFRNTNSSKGDRLPSLDDFLEPFCAQQFSALMALRGTGRHRKILEAYVQMHPDLAAFEDTPACRQVFAERVDKVVRPLHQIAANQGFALWRPEWEYAAVRV